MHPAQAFSLDELKVLDMAFTRATFQILLVVTTACSQPHQQTPSRKTSTHPPTTIGLHESCIEQAMCRSGYRCITWGNMSTCEIPCKEHQDCPPPTSCSGEVFLDGPGAVCIETGKIPDTWSPPPLAISVHGDLANAVQAARIDFTSFLAEETKQRVRHSEMTRCMANINRYIFSIDVLNGVYEIKITPDGSCIAPEYLGPALGGGARYLVEPRTLRIVVRELGE
jgi:hypothetical protein